MEGIIGIKPKMKSITFPSKEKMRFDLEDGRSITIPTFYFPNIDKLSSEQRKKLSSTKSFFMFEDDDEVYHIEQVLGVYEDYGHFLVDKPFQKQLEPVGA